MFGAEEATAFGQSGVNSVLSKKMSEKEFEQNKYMQEYAFNRNQQAWEMANEYNTPVKQMQRLTDAGINPHLAYAKGTINNVASGQLPKYQAAEMDYNKPEMGIKNAVGYSKISDYVDLKRKNAEADIATNTAKTEGFKANILEGTWQNQIDQQIQKLEKLRAETNSENAKNLYTRQMAAWAEQKTRYETEKADMAESRIFQGDAWYWRQGDRLLDALMQSFTKSFGYDYKTGETKTLHYK